MKTILTPQQIEYLRGITIPPSEGPTCGRLECSDSYQLVNIEVATALSTYGVRGDQFAAIVMDLMAALTNGAQALPFYRMDPLVSRYVQMSMRIAAVAHRQFEESNPDA